MSRYLPIVCLSLMHAVVDAVAMFIEPLWPELRTTLKLSEAELFVLLSVTAVAPNFSQILFGFVQDRYGSRYLLWLGPAAAAVCLSLIGTAGMVGSLGLLLAAGYVAIGSFHPEAAVFAGKLLPEHRTRAISLFMFGGTMGLGIGPAFTLEQRGYATDTIGNVQSLFLVCGSLGILLIGSRYGRGSERWLMIYSPLAAVPLMIGLAIPGCPTWLLVALLVPSGVMLVGTTPAMVSYAHQLFPRDAGKASALTMGLSWGTSGLAVAGMTSVFVDQFHEPTLLFAAFVPCLAGSAAGAIFLPHVESAKVPQLEAARCVQRFRADAPELRGATPFDDQLS